MSGNTNTVAEKGLRALREGANLTQEGCAELVSQHYDPGIGRHTWRAWERGQRPVTVEQFQAISEAFKLSRPQKDALMTWIVSVRQEFKATA